MQRIINLHTPPRGAVSAMFRILDVMRVFPEVRSVNAGLDPHHELDILCQSLAKEEYGTESTSSPKRIVLDRYLKWEAVRMAIGDPHEFCKALQAVPTKIWPSESTREYLRYHGIPPDIVEEDHRDDPKKGECVVMRHLIPGFVSPEILEDMNLDVLHPEMVMKARLRGEDYRPDFPAAEHHTQDIGDINLLSKCLRSAIQSQMLYTNIGDKMQLMDDLSDFIEILRTLDAQPKTENPFEYYEPTPDPEHRQRELMATDIPAYESATDVAKDAFEHTTSLKVEADSQMNELLQEAKHLVESQVLFK